MGPRIEGCLGSAFISGAGDPMVAPRQAIDRGGAGQRRCRWNPVGRATGSDPDMASTAASGPRRSAMAHLETWTTFVKRAIPYGTTALPTSTQLARRSQAREGEHHDLSG